MINKPTFVEPDFTRLLVKYEQFIRPMGLFCKISNVSHPGLGMTVQLPITNVKKPSKTLCRRNWGLMKGTIIEVKVNVSWDW